MNTVASPLLPTPVTATSARTWLARTRAAVWHALELAAWARAQGHLLEFADRCEALQPDLASELRAAARRGPLA